MGLDDLVEEDEMHGRAVRVDLEIARVHDDQLDPFEQTNRHHWISNHTKQLKLSFCDVFEINKKFLFFLRQAFYELVQVG